jgi:hypothetical protein
LKKRLVFMLEKALLWVSGIVSLVTLSLILCNKHDVSLIVGRFWIMRKFLNLLHLILILWNLSLTDLKNINNLRSLIKAHAQYILTPSNYDQEKIINQVVVGKCKWKPTRIGKPPSFLSLVFLVGFWCVIIQGGLNHVYNILGPLKVYSRICVWNLCWVVLRFHVGWTFVKFKKSIIWSLWVLVNVKESSIAKTIEGLSSIELNMKRWCGFEFAK